MTAPSSFTGLRQPKRPGNEELKYLPSQQKKDLCIELLHEFGASNVRVAGPELRHNCTLPFGGHSDNNSYAASVNYEIMGFNCYVCDFGGSVAWWIAANRGEDVDKVEPWLKARLGLGSALPLDDLMKVIDDICNPPSNKRILPKYPEKILERWTDWDNFSDTAINYLINKRKIPEETLERYQIGYAHADTEFDYYQRIIIPVYWKGTLVGWQARALARPPVDPYGSSKYKNSVGFPGDRVLYGQCGPRIREAVVVESPMSVLRHDHQRPPVLATLGSDVTAEQLRVLESIDHVILFNENDKAGWKMSRKVSRYLERKTQVSIVVNPYVDVDPADLDDDTYIGLVREAVPSSIWTPKMWRDQVQYIASESN